MSQQNHVGRQFISIAEASERFNLSRTYLKYLARIGRVEGIKPGGHDWLIYEDSLQTFLAQPRSKGRKGPRKKRIVQHTEQGERVLLSTAEASAISGYRQDSLLRLLRRGAIEGEKSGRTWLIYEDSLLDYLAAHKRQPRESPSSSLPAEPSPDK